MSPCWTRTGWRGRREAKKTGNREKRPAAPTAAREHGRRCPIGKFCPPSGPKASKGERREAGIQWIQPPKAVSDRSFRQTTSGAHGSANRADCLPQGKPFGAPAGAQLLPTGSDAPTAARVMGLPPRRGIVLSFGAKESTKESKRHGATEKRLLLPILTAGLAMSRAMELDSLHTGAERARARLFPPSKWAGLFPSAAYRRPAPAQLAGGILNPCGLG